MYTAHQLDQADKCYVGHSMVSTALNISISNKDVFCYKLYGVSQSTGLLLLVLISIGAGKGFVLNIHKGV